MNILYLVTWYDDFKKKHHAGSFHKELAELLIDKREDIAICFPFDDIEVNGFLKTFDNRITIYRYKNFTNCIFLIKLINTIKFILSFKYIIRDFKPDIIHAHVGRVAGFYAFLLSKIYNIPYVISEHAPIEQLGLNNTIVSYKNKLVYKNSCYNTCCSKYNYDILHSKYNDINFDIIYNPVDIKNVILLNKKFKIDNVVNACIVGNFYDKYIKGYQYLLPSLKIVKDEKYKIMLHIVGGGVFFGFYKNFAKELGISDSCIFYNNCDRNTTNTIISQMDFCISASLTESAGIFCEEAMSYGKPLLVTKSGGANSLCNEKTAYIVDKGSAEELYKGIVYMIKNHNTFDNNYIQKYACSNFNSEMITEKYINIYNSVINRKRNNEC